MIYLKTYKDFDIEDDVSVITDPEEHDFDIVDVKIDENNNYLYVLDY